MKLALVHALRAAGPRGATKAELVATIGNTSAVSVQRALTELRGETHEAPIECTGRDRRWRLLRPFGMPLDAPDREDLVAVLIAQAILEPLADGELKERIERLVVDLDERVRRFAPEGALGSLPSRASVSATLTLGTPVGAGILRVLLATCRRRVLRILYDSPWKPPEEGRRTYDIEPWAVRVHDGAVYLRAWGREAEAPRTFRVAQIESVSELDVDRCGRVPTNDQIWGDDHPAFGIDRDRPGTARIRLRGPVARWVAHVIWHPAQVDRWSEDCEGHVLERTVKYRSCRELARRLASVIDAVVGVQPRELADELAALLASGARTTEVARGQTRDDLPGIIQRVRAGTAGKHAASSRQAQRACEPTPTGWSDPYGDE